MGKATVRGGFDTWADETKPSREHGGQRFLRIATGTKWAYLWLKNPAPRHAVVTSAILRVHARLDWPGTTTLTARRVADSWKARRLNWNNKPATTGLGVDATITDAKSGDAIDFDVTQHVQNMVDGASNYGWRIVTDSADTIRLWGFNSDHWHPHLIVEWSDKPSVPTNLYPDGVVSVQYPLFGCDYGDVNGDDIVSIQVQIDPNGNASAPAFDSGEVSTTEPEWDPAGSAWPGLANLAGSKQRQRVKDSGGQWSDWSDWVDFSRTDKGALTIDNPAAAPNAFVWEPTPPILATLTGATLAAYQVRITKGDDRSHLLYDSEKIKQAGGTIAHTIPKKWEKRRVLRDDQDYQVNVRAWDDVKDRIATPGDPIFQWEWRTFAVNEDATVTGVASLTAEQIGITPGVRLTFTRSTAPDSFNVLRKEGNGDWQVIESDLDPADYLQSGTTTYVFDDYTANPKKLQTYAVRAVVNDRQSNKGPTPSLRVNPSGIWIIDYRRDLSFVVGGKDVDNWTMTDQDAVYRTSGADTIVKITTGMYGLAGTFEGPMFDRVRETGRDLDSFERDLWTIKERPDETVQLIAGALSIPVVLQNLSCAPDRDSSTDNQRRKVSFGFYQDGDLPFDARI